MKRKEEIKLKLKNMGKRSEVEKLIYKVMDALDPSGVNSKKYRTMFSTMSDTRFEKFMSDMFEDDNINFTLDIEDFERELTLENSEKAAKILNIPLMERVIMPFSNMDREHPTVTKVPVFVGYHIEKRMQQMNLKKNSTSIHISERSATTGQVVGNDKNGRSSDQENVALTVMGADNILKEINGFRSDGLQRKNYAYASISKNGYCSLEEAEAQAGIEDRTALNTVDVFYTGMGIKTDLVSPDLLLVSTAKKG